MTLRPLFALSAGLLSLVAATRGATYAPEQVREDLRYLYETLQASHYDLFAHTAKADYDLAYRQAREAVDRPLDDLGAYRVLQAFVVRAGMAHCNIGFPFQAVYGPYVMGGGTTIPFDLTFAGDRAFLRHNYSDQAALVPGSEILAIDGRPVAAVIEDIGPYLSGDNAYMKRTSIELMGFPRLHWLAFGEAKKFRLALRQPDGTRCEVEADAVPALQFEQRAAAHKPLADPSREFRFIGDTAYFRPGAFLNNQAGADLAAHATFDKGEFIGFLDAAFRDLRERRSTALIIDLRGNPGGDNSFSDPMVAYVADRPFRFCSRFEVRTSPVTKAFWQGVGDPALAELKAAILTHADGERFPVELPWVNPRAGVERFQGRVLVLVDRFSFSNAVTTAAIFQDFRFGTIVGEETADVPTTYAAAHQFTLPATQLTVVYPKARIVRPNGDPAPRGVRPDYAVADDAFTPEDEVLQAALALIAGGTAR